MKRETYTIDASGRAIGRIATEVVNFLRGKNEPTFERHTDTGSFVIVENVKEVKFTGKKIEQKKYYHYSGYQSGMKEKKIKDVFEKNPDDVLRRAVLKMLPRNRLRDAMIQRLTIK